MLIVWGRRNSLNVQKVMWAIGELGLEYTRKDVGGSFGGVDTDHYAKMNPNRRVPVLDDNGFIMWESNAVVRYLAAQYDAGGLWPTDLQTRAVADQWMDWMQTTLLPDMTTIFFNLVRKPVDQRDSAAFSAAAGSVGDLYGRLDSHLAKHPYIAGDTLTIGDIPVGAAYNRYCHLDVQRPDLPNLQAWYQRLTERPAFQKHIMIPFGSTPEEWAALEQAGANQ